MAERKPEAPTLRLHQRMLAVMAEVGYVKKDTVVQAGGGRTYSGVSHDAVIAALRPSLVKHGILVYTSQLKEHAIDGVTRQGHPKLRYEAWYEVFFVSAYDPEDHISIKIHAHSEDSGDKAPGKAISYATKMALLKAFALETGEDDEARTRPDDPVELVNDEEVSKLETLISMTGADLTKFLQYFRIADLRAMPKTKYAAAVAMLEKKAAGPLEPSESHEE